MCRDDVATGSAVVVVVPWIAPGIVSRSDCLGGGGASSINYGDLVCEQRKGDSFEKGKLVEGRWQQAQPAWERFVAIAMQDTGQARRVADFLLSWHNAGDNGGWNPADFWSVDESVADDILTVLRLIPECRCDPDELG